MVNIRIIDLATFFKLFGLVNKAPGDQVSVTTKLIEGDIESAFDRFQRAIVSIFDRPERRKEFISTLLTGGIIRMVSQQFEFKKSVTFGGITIGI